jgi:hypothetical protein
LAFRTLAIKAARSLGGANFSANARALDTTPVGIAGQYTPSVITLPTLSNAAKSYEISTGMPATAKAL